MKLLQHLVWNSGAALGAIGPHAWASVTVRCIMPSHSRHIVAAFDQSRNGFKVLLIAWNNFWLRGRLALVLFRKMNHKADKF